MSNQAWVTLATNDSYSLGALVLAHSLRRVGSTFPAVVLITPSVTEPMRDRLRAVFAEVILVDVLDSQDAAHLALLQRPELGITFTKIHCWSLTQYEKCVFLDADVLVVQNCDELFEREELSAAPDVGWPDCFNSGVFVFRPSKETFDAIIKFAQERGSFDGGDQGLLNSFFSDWSRADNSKRLPFLYNVTSAAFYSYLPAFKQFGQDIKIIHFIGATKPWLQNYNWDLKTVDAPGHLQENLKRWWDIFVSQVHPQLDTAMVDQLGENQDPPVRVQSLEFVNIQEEKDRSGFYKIIENPDSEFPWHHPVNSLNEDDSKSNTDFSNVFDPWDRYVGNIPPGEDVWQYKESQECYWPSNSNVSQTNESQQHYYHESHHHRDEAHHYIHNNQETHQNIYDNQEHHQNIHHHQEHQHIETNHHNWHGAHHHEQVSTYDNQHHQINDHHDHQSHHYQQNHNSENKTQENNQNIDHQHYQNHAHNQTHQDRSRMTEPHAHNWKEHDQVNTDKHIHSQNAHMHNHIDKLDGTNNSITKVEKKRPRNKVRRRRLLRIDICSDPPLNGHLESDSEEETPRHPYDGFYLRHTMTVDPHGRRVCSHQLLLSQPPSPPPSPIEVQPQAQLENHQQSGVAGSLAKIVPGPEGYQRDAIDEVSRRQGWETGNIDYMGADSFDNIWAKISQTLSQAPKRPSPPKQPSPPKRTSPPKEPSTPKESSVPKQPSPPKELSPPEQVTKPKQPSPPKETETIDQVKSDPNAISKTEEQVLKPEAKLETDTIPKKVEEKPIESKTEPLVETQPAPVPIKSEEVSVLQNVPAEPEQKPSESIQPETKQVEPIVGQTVEEIKPVPKDPKPIEESKPLTNVKDLPAATQQVAETIKPIEENKPEAKVPPTPPGTPKSSTPVTESAPVLDITPVKVVESKPADPASEATPVKAEQTDSTSSKQTSVESSLESSDTSYKTVNTSDPNVDALSSGDSPPLVSTPSKETPPTPSVAKTKKPAGKLQLCPPQAADPLPTPDSELEDAATLAQGIIARELATIASPTVTAPTPPIQSPPTPQSPKSSQTLKKGLSVESPVLPTPPAGPVSLEQIGVKPTKQTIAAQIETSVAAKSQPETKEPEAAKKTVKKTVKKEAAAGAPVPPPRKKEKKPK